MKKTMDIKKYKAWIAATVFLFGIMLANGSFAQADTAQPPATDTTAVAAEEPVADEQAPELIAPAIDFSSVQKGDNSIDLKVKLRAKVKGQFYNLYKMKISFFRVVNGEEIPLGFAITNGEGKVVYNVKADTLTTDAEGKLQFKAVFAGNKAMDPAEEYVSFKRARLEITPVKEDSLMTVQVKLVEIGSGTETPVKETAVGIFVKRLFLPQKVGEGTTDENGQASVEFPNNLPGDAKGNLTLLARLDENETYGNLEASVVQPWGLPVSIHSEGGQRTLWSSNPPIWMLITFIVLMLAVWGHYVVIVYELIRLRKEQPNVPTDATKS